MIRLMHGDTVEQMRSLPSESFDACVTDPPYGLTEPRSGMSGMLPRSDTQKQARRTGFMGKAWDAETPGVPYWAEVLRLLKPGAYLLAFGGTRTFHRLTCAIEDAGFSIQDCLMWLHGQGFPKGKSQLKPAWEPIILARKPGKGAGLNIAAARITAQAGDYDHPGNTLGHRDDETSWRIQKRKVEPHAAGRWPANVVLSHEPECQEVGTRRVKGAGGSDMFSTALGRMNDDAWQPKEVQRTKHFDADGLETVPAFQCVESCAVRLLDEQAGESTSRGGFTPGSTGAFGKRGVYSGAHVGQSDREWTGFGDTGGPSRFFYTSKASTADRGEYNDHPTVKSLSLMDWLLKLVVPPGGHVLDCFAGSGSTLVAADRLGFSATGIDSDAHALDIARRRLAEDGGMFSEVVG